MIHGKAIWKLGIGKIAKASGNTAPRPHKGAYNTPYEPPAARVNMLTPVGLWPSWKTEVRKSAWIYIYIYIVLQIRDYFQLVGQWAERLKGILSPKVVQERCIFLLPRSTKNAENWFYEYNVQEVNSTKILSKYTFTH